MTDCTLSGNSSFGEGGGLYSSGQLSVEDCTLTGNEGIDVSIGAGSNTMVSDET